MMTPFLALAFVAAVGLAAHTLTPSKRFYNWVDVTFTPDPVPPATTSTPLVITGVTDLRLNTRAAVDSFAGDNDIAPTTKIVPYIDPQIVITTADLTAIHALGPNVRGTFSATHLDAHNGNQAGGGGYTITVAHAIITDTPSGGAYRGWGQGTLTVEMESPDGVTLPWGLTAL